MKFLKWFWCCLFHSKHWDVYYVELDNDFKTHCSCTICKRKWTLT